MEQDITVQELKIGIDELVNGIIKREKADEVQMILNDLHSKRLNLLIHGLPNEATWETKQKKVSKRSERFYSKQNENANG